MKPVKPTKSSKSTKQTNAAPSPFSKKNIGLAAGIAIGLVAVISLIIYFTDTRAGVAPIDEADAQSRWSESNVKGGSTPKKK